ncbi:MAG: nicotinate-nucleotide--dimethylbenzimidazole phosphoribosyltransferase [Clostridia bacterium]|nr:MAG: nicotinate-nucleotide--dimethylbenzimidazole phosphoribosyltransferase [Clostridia bacterium]
MLTDVIMGIRPLDYEAMRQARERLDSLTKPLGSLGRLEEIAERVAGITGNPLPPVPRKTAILLAADHGVVVEGVSAYPQEVTLQMLANFAGGGAGMNVLCRHAGIELWVVDIGVAADTRGMTGVSNRKVACGTANMAAGPAMSRETALQALETGVSLAREAVETGAGLLITGEMGIGNTTPASALAAFYTGITPEEAVGSGSGINQERRQNKIRAVAQALEINKPDRNDPVDVVAKIGGLEIAGMAGIMLAGAAGRVPVLVDGFISTAAALVAAHLCPAVKDYLLGTHVSQEPAHRVMLEFLGLAPMLVMEMRLGEGTGAALAAPVVDAALKVLHEMATFGEAGVSKALDN